MLPILRCVLQIMTLCHWQFNSLSVLHGYGSSVSRRAIMVNKDLLLTRDEREQIWWDFLIVCKRLEGKSRLNFLLKFLKSIITANLKRFFNYCGYRFVKVKRYQNTWDSRKIGSISSKWPINNLVPSLITYILTSWINRSRIIMPYKSNHCGGCCVNWANKTSNQGV